MSDIRVAEIKTDTIKNQAGTTAVNINSSGVITVPNRPAFSVQCNRSSAMSASNSFTQSHASTIVTLNQGSHFNNTTGIFTCPVAGIYSVFFNLNNKVTTSTFMGAHVCLNGNLKAQSWSGTTDAYNNATTSIFLDCSASDEIGCGYRNDYQTPSTLAGYQHIVISLIG